VRLLLDEMYPRLLAEELRDAGYDVVAVVERPDLIGRSDLDIVRWALDDRRVVVTENVVDFAVLDAADHAGLLLVNARRWPRTAAGRGRLRDALAAWLDRPRDEKHYLLDWL
jgi:hypothetical protein